MLNKSVTVTKNYKGFHIVVTQEVDGTAQFVIFEGEITKNDELETGRIVSTGHNHQPTKELIKEKDMEQLIDKIIRMKKKAGDK